MIGVGVIGFGYWGPNLVRNIAALPGADLRVVCDRESGRLEEVGRLYPTIDLIDSVTELLGRGDIDAIILATPADTHFELTRQVLASGRSVFVEKPLARSTAECEQLIELAAQKDLVLMVGTPSNTMPPWSTSTTSSHDATWGRSITSTHSG
jgi:predicted dehydrogenase